jgi:hypothetical protein
MSYVNQMPAFTAYARFMLEAIASGSWLTQRRITAIAAMALAATILSLVVLFAGAHGTLDAIGRPLGTDFSNIWTAGWMADHGRAALAWNWPAQHVVQVATHRSPAVPFYGWHYPPPFLLIAALLATLPYVPALILWQAATLVPALLLVRRIVSSSIDPQRTSLVASGAPVVLVCLGHGHNGFLSAFLLGGGLLLLDRRPFVAGLLIGCLAYKPQLALLQPLVLLAGGHWRAGAGAACSAALLCIITLAIWGWPVWQAFLASLPLTRTVVIEQGSTGWEKIASAFSFVRMWGGAVPLAYGVQAAVTGAALLGAVLATRMAAAPVRNAAVMAAALLSTPYVLDYDFAILGVALAFLVADGRARGFLRWEASLLAFAWAAPMFARNLTALTGVPIALIAAIAVFTLALRRAIVLDGAAVMLRSSPFRRSHAESAP